MRVALVQPRWSFEGGIYFGCREPHLPLELAYSEALLGAAGHEAFVVDADGEGLSHDEAASRVLEGRPDAVALATAPTYLFWRCAPPELRVPMELLSSLRRAAEGGGGGVAPRIVAVGPHGSTTPRAVLRKLGADAVVLGECEEVLVRLAGTPPEDWHRVPSVCAPHGGEARVNGGPHASAMDALPPLRWPLAAVRRHPHHHHRFEATPRGPGAEVEASRGCPYRCTFCAKERFRDGYRRRPLPVLLSELDGLLSQGVEYVYFIDEIFLPDRPLLRALAERRVPFGVQTRIDLWKPEMLDLLGQAGCVSIEAGVESVTPEGRDRLAKDCRMDSAALAERLSHAKGAVPFVQANLIRSPEDDPEAVAAWRRDLNARGVWANEPVPLFPYPGSPEYTRRWGPPDDRAWERAVDAYLAEHGAFSDLQERDPLPLQDLERRGTDVS
ncbi:TIGR04295 family B12-binding domain-containing radical SAM protein [Myxococcota bacterium]|nr:TIGR04295 family B12-binding domain-containing radical SAM protein [Myxococcota bacterium]